MKRLLPALLLAAMLTSLASCGGDTSAPSGDTTAPAGDGTTAAEPSEYVNPGVDYGGKTVTVAAHHYESEWKIDAYFLTAEEENGDVINDAIVKSRRAVEETLNVKFELMPLDIKARTDPSPLTKFILAGEDAFQISIHASLSATLGRFAMGLSSTTPSSRPAFSLPVPARRVSRKPLSVSSR